MKTIMVRYKVKSDKVAENEAYVKAVFDQLNREKPEGVHYSAFQLEDGVSFVHLAAYDEGVDRSALVELSAFKAYTAGVMDRCEEPPEQVWLQSVGAYNTFGELVPVGGKA